MAAQLHDADPAPLGRRIRDRRLARSMTQSDLSQGDVTVGYISKIESGQRRPDARLCTVLAERLGTTAEFLITGVEVDQAQENRLALRYAELSLESGDVAVAEERAATLLRSADLLSVRDTVDAHYLHARSLESLGRIDDAITELEEVIAAGTATLRWLPASTALSRCLRESGDLNRAIEVGNATLAQLAEAGLAGTDDAVQLAVTVAAAFFARGDVSHAIRLARSASADADAIGSAQARGSAYWNASVFEAGRGSTDAAIPLAERALALLGEGNDARNLARLRCQLGRMLLRSDPPEHVEALAVLRQAREEMTHSSASQVDFARCDATSARALLMAGDLDAARDLAAAAAAASEDLAPMVAADALAVLGQVAAGGGDQRLAREHYRNAVARLTAVGADRTAAQLWLELGALLDEAGDAEAARDAYLSAAVSTGLQIPLNTPVRH